MNVNRVSKAYLVGPGCDAGGVALFKGPPHACLLLNPVLQHAGVVDGRQIINVDERPQTVHISVSVSVWLHCNILNPPLQALFACMYHTLC